MFYTYVLLSEKDNKFYLGFTANLKRRLLEHNTGQVISTRKRQPLKLIMYEAYTIEADARDREKFFKTTKGKLELRKQLKHFLSENPAGLAQW